MDNFAFSPAHLGVRAGTTVVWTNHDTARHSTTSDGGVWDSGLFDEEERFSFKFDLPGVYPYYCSAHGGMGGAGMSAEVTVIP
ncbi:MAG: plastocyanin/azurin family copper-binding protein [Chloroflexota bacterium]